MFMSLKGETLAKLCHCRDFYNVRKVDTHVHHSASMNQKHLLRFIKSESHYYVFRGESSDANPGLNFDR
jgi:hypothetical protein